MLVTFNNTLDKNLYTNNYGCSFKKKQLVSAVKKMSENTTQIASLALTSTALAGIAINKGFIIKQDKNSQTYDIDEKLNSIKQIIAKKELGNDYEQKILVACQDGEGNFNYDALDSAYNQLAKNVRDFLVVKNINCCKVNNKFDENAIHLLKEWVKQYNYRTNSRDFMDYANICVFQNGEYSDLAVKRIVNEFENPSVLSNLCYSISDFQLYRFDKNNVLVNKILANDMFFINSDARKRANFLLNYIERSSKKPESLEILNLLVSDKSNSSKLISNIVEALTINIESKSLVANLLQDKDFPNELICNVIKNKKGNEYIEEIKKNDTKRHFEVLKIHMLHAPELYVNGEYNSKLKAQNAVLNFMVDEAVLLADMVNTFDKETVDFIMRKRFDEVKIFGKQFKKLSDEEKNLLTSLQTCSNVYNKPLLPNQKAEFLALILGIKEDQNCLNKLQKMVNNKIVDLEDLEKTILDYLLRKSGFSKEEILSVFKEGLKDFDLSKVHLIAKEWRETKDETFALFLQTMFRGDFKNYIQDSRNTYGAINAITKAKYENANLNYDKWLNPDKNLEYRFVNTSNTSEQLLWIGKELTEDINTLRETPAKKSIDKKLSKYIVDDKVVLPNELIEDKVRLENFIKNLIHNLNEVWKRSENNLKSSDMEIVLRAKTNLDILAKFEQYINDIPAMENINKFDNLDLTIKMWDRNPKKDIYQGNYSTCCIGMGEANGYAMLHYLMNTAFNMIELKDNSTGEIIGNALCYFVNTKNGPALVIDNIEINNKVTLSNKAGEKLCSALATYAENFANSVTGKKTLVYLGADNNDLPVLTSGHYPCNVSFIGEIDCDEIYLDMRDGWCDKDCIDGYVQMRKLVKGLYNTELYSRLHT